MRSLLRSPGGDLGLGGMAWIGFGDSTPATTAPFTLGLAALFWISSLGLRLGLAVSRATLAAAAILSGRPLSRRRATVGGRGTFAARASRGVRLRGLSLFSALFRMFRGLRRLDSSWRGPTKHRSSAKRRIVGRIPSGGEGILQRVSAREGVLKRLLGLGMGARSARAGLVRLGLDR
jgi:hypothetical protein